MIRATLLILLSIAYAVSFSQTTMSYKNAKLPVSERVKDLLSRMTPEEKFWQLMMIPGELTPGKEDDYKNGIFGFQVSAASSNGDAAQQKENPLALVRKINAMQHYFVEKTRLGIPIIAFDEALHGLVRDGATVFPQAIGLAATWDTTMMSKVAGAIAVETSARGIRQILSPVINIAGDVRWGRVEETYGEDPFLTSEMGVAFVKPFESIGIITTPKHFIANVGDGGRDSYPTLYSDRLLEETYFPPFKAVIARGGSRSIMTAYNSLNGIQCSANDWLLNKKLKQEWKFGGFVISDAGAVGGANVLHFTARDYPESGRQAVSNGLDVIFQTAYDHYKLFIPPFLNGSLDPHKIDAAVARILKAKFELGLFENPYVPETEVKKDVGDNRHKVIAKQAALESIVLLKNNKKVLPLSKTIRTIAVIGEDAAEARLGGYSGPGNGKVSILDGIRKHANNITVTYSAGCGRKLAAWTTVPSEFLSCDVNGKKEKGLQGTYFNNVTLSGTPDLTRIDHDVDFHWTLFSPDPVIASDFYSVRWTGTVTSPRAGKIKIGLDGNDGYRMFLDGKLLVDHWSKQTYSTSLAGFVFEKDKPYDLKIEFYEPVGNAHIKLIWDLDFPDSGGWKDKIEMAAENVRNADVAIVVAGITEGEFQDRAYLNLPGHQEEMIRKIAATGKPVVVVLVGGSAITMNAWLDNVDAVIDAWYPGEEGGNAVADVLFGDCNPAGRLPITFPVAEAQLPLVYRHLPTGRGDDYNNLSGLPLFPFGFGLSYTRFEYDNLVLDDTSISRKGRTVVHCSIRNTGDMAGDEVVQLYIRDLLASVARPVMELKGFQRIRLLPGEVKTVSFNVTPEMLMMLDENLKAKVEAGEFRLMIGASSRDIRLKTNLRVVE